MALDIRDFEVNVTKILPGALSQKQMNIEMKFKNNSGK